MLITYYLSSTLICCLCSISAAWFHENINFKCQASSEAMISCSQLLPLSNLSKSLILSRCRSRKLNRKFGSRIDRQEPLRDYVWTSRQITKLCLHDDIIEMETSSALLAFCAGNSPVTGEFHAQRPVTRSFDDFVDLRLNKQLSKQSWGWWFETPLGSLWCHCNVFSVHLWANIWAPESYSQSSQSELTNCLANRLSPKLLLLCFSKPSAFTSSTR